MKAEDNLDKLDAEFVEETLGTRGYGLIDERLQGAITAGIQALRVQTDHDKTQYQRGFIDGLERAKLIPKIIIDEGRDK